MSSDTAEENLAKPAVVPRFDVLIRRIGDSTRFGAFETHPLETTLRIGSDDGNDIVLDGRDVEARHAVIDLTGRGPQLMLLGAAEASVGGARARGTVGVVPGDGILIGGNRLTIELRVGLRDGIGNWVLVSGDGRLSLRVERDVSVGKAGCDLELADDRVSASHATFVPRGEYLWVRDLSGGSTFVDNIAVAGAVMLREGDTVRFGPDESFVVADSEVAAERLRTTRAASMKPLTRPDRVRRPERRAPTVQPGLPAVEEARAPTPPSPATAPAAAEPRYRAPTQARDVTQTTSVEIPVADFGWPPKRPPRRWLAVGTLFVVVVAAAFLVPEDWSRWLAGAGTKLTDALPTPATSQGAVQNAARDGSIEPGAPGSVSTRPRSSGEAIDSLGADASDRVGVLEPPVTSTSDERPEGPAAAASGGPEPPSEVAPESADMPALIRLLKTDPGNAAASTQLRAALDQAATAIEVALAGHRFGSAETQLERLARQGLPTTDQPRYVEADTWKRLQVARLLVRADELMQQRLIVAPTGESALSYLQEALRLAPQNTVARDMSEKAEGYLLQASRRAEQNGEVDESHRLAEMAALVRDATRT
jgi:pSer/pThr/pTyr-binding forkhead associated (FHA) protein